MSDLNPVKLFGLSAAFSVLMVSSAQAGLFSIEVSSEGATYTESYDSVSELVDDLDLSEVNDVIPAYTDTSAITTVINFRGLPVTLSAAAGSSAITMNIDAINVTTTFSGADRDDSMDQLEAWFEGDGEDALTRLLQELAASTPSDPVAGNPTSLVSRSVGTDFDYATDTGVGAIELNVPQKSLNGNMVSVFARYSNYSSDGVESREYSLPLSYSIRFDDSEDKLTIRLPVAYVVYDGSVVYNAGLGVGYGKQINSAWRLTPAVGYSLVGSEDMGSLAQVISTSVVSSYLIKVEEYSISIGNMLGYYSTLPTSAGDVSQDPDISNTVLRNGVSLNIPTPQVAKDSSVEFFLTDTRYFGSDLYIDQYNEIGFSVGIDRYTLKESQGGYVNYLKRLRGGVKYLFSENSSGYSVSFGYTF